MRSLPATRYEYIEFKLVRVNVDYHIEYEKHFYSVPQHLVKLQLEVQVTREGAVLFFKGNQIARYPRSYSKGAFSADPNHMPESHRQNQQWLEERLSN